jgi:hypothetical protein
MLFAESNRAFKRLYGRHLANTDASLQFAFNPFKSNEQMLAGAPAFPLSLIMGGGWIRAILCVGVWIWVIFTIRSSPELPWYGAVLFALPGGGLIAMAIYNVRLSHLRRAYARELEERMPRLRKSTEKHSWNRRVLHSTDDSEKMRDFAFACAGLARATGTAAFLAVSAGGYYLGLHVFRLPPLGWPQPTWTVGHIALFCGCVLGGTIAGLAGLVAGARIQIRDNNMSTFITALWHNTATNALTWFFLLGAFLTWHLGKSEVQQVFLRYGPERGFFQMFAVGALIGFISTLLLYVVLRCRLRPSLHLIPAGMIAMAAARWHWQQWGLTDRWWLVAFVLPIFGYIFAIPFIQRDLKQRMIATEGRE